MQPIHRYDYYVHLLVDKPWRVPVLYGRLPRTPDESSTNSEKCCYGLFLMLLFRSHRSVEQLLNWSVGPTSVYPSPIGTIDEAWQNIYTEFQRWKTEDVDRIALPYFKRNENCERPRPLFDSLDWWACMISEKLRNYDMSQRKHIVEAFNVPTNATLLLRKLSGRIQNHGLVNVICRPRGAGQSAFALYAE